jgi:hypothetical protein
MLRRGPAALRGRVSRRPDPKSRASKRTWDLWVPVSILARFVLFLAHMSTWCELIGRKRARTFDQARAEESPRE